MMTAAHLLVPLLIMSANNSMKKKSWTMIISFFFIVSTGFMVSAYNPLYAPFTHINESAFGDSLSFNLSALTLWLASLSMMASVSIKLSKTSSTMFSITIIILSVSLISSFFMLTLSSFYFFFEFSLLPTFLLILMWGGQPERLNASIYLLMYTICASLPLLLTILMLNKSGSIQMVMEVTTNNKPMLTFIWWMFMILAFIVKMPIFSVHIWLPKAHVEAPVSGSMFLAGILLKLGSYGVIRLTTLFSKTSFMFFTPLSVIALWGGVLSTAICLQQSDMKSLVAYSSIAHMAMSLAAILCVSYLGLNSGIIMLYAHGLCSSGLFCLTNSNYSQTKTRSLVLTKSSSSLMKSLMIWWFLLLMGNMASPPSINLISELTLFPAIIMKTSVLLAPMIIISILTAAFCLLLYTATSHGQMNKPVMMNSIKPIHSLMATLHVTPMFLLTLSTEMLF